MSETTTTPETLGESPAPVRQLKGNLGVAATGSAKRLYDIPAELRLTVCPFLFSSQASSFALTSLDHVNETCAVAVNVTFSASKYALLEIWIDAAVG